VSQKKPEPAYDAAFIGTVIERLHRYSVSDIDARGLAGMLGSVDALAEAAAKGLGFDDEPADFLRVMQAERGGGGQGGDS
jgi:hypothetical protein